MAGEEQNSLMVNQAVINPAAMQGAASGDEEPAPLKAARNTAFDDKMREFTIAENADVMNKDIATSDLMQRAVDREYEELEKWKNDTKLFATLSAAQRMELDARMQMLDYSKQSNDIQDAYLSNPDDPKAKKDYQKLEDDFKEYRLAMQNEPEFQGSKAIEKMRELEQQLEAAGGEQVNNIKQQMNEAMRDFREELIKESKENPDAVQEKVLKFIERNKEIAMIKESGMLASAEAIRESRAEREQDKEEGLENQPVTANGNARAGGVNADTLMARDAANNEVAAAGDDGRQGTIERPRIEGGMETDEIWVNSGGPGQQRENAAGLA